MKLHMLAAFTGLIVAGTPAVAQVVTERTTTIETIAPPPPEVRTYITTQQVPTVTYGREVVVGRPLQGSVTYMEVPSHPSYRWVHLDGHRVVVDARTNNVVTVY